VTAGFYSKDWILWETWTSPQGGFWLWIGGAAGTFVTALYSFRLLFFVFFGEIKTEPHGKQGPAMTIPLVVLAVLSLLIGFLEVPRTLGDWPLFSRFLGTALPMEHGAAAALSMEAVHQGLLALLSIAGIGAAYLLYRAAPAGFFDVAATGPMEALSRLWFEGWWFDRFYEGFIVRPFTRMAELNRGDAIDAVYTSLARLTTSAHESLSATQTGSVRWYATVLAGSAVLFIWYMIT
jgi:NADH-quinone oxidoreductase subunit L